MARTNTKTAKTVPTTTPAPAPKPTYTAQKIYDRIVERVYTGAFEEYNKTLEAMTTPAAQKSLYAVAQYARNLAIATANLATAAQFITELNKHMTYFNEMTATVSGYGAFFSLNARVLVPTRNFAGRMTTNHALYGKSHQGFTSQPIMNEMNNHVLEGRTQALRRIHNTMEVYDFVAEPAELTYFSECFAISPTPVTLITPVQVEDGI